ncbi:MAG: hypothetical protein JKY53_12425 [Flavobacteriales bacterium]|nr:hypothetical protein [Flavobacteriales bacterium]
MEPLKLRLLISYVEGATIAYLYNREAFELLGIEKDTFDGSQFVEIGKEIEYDGTKYTVENINFKMYKELYEVDNTVGINIHSPTDLMDYSCQIGIFVSEIE